ncbi:hypothetical protein D7S89_03365 [Trinickia fusca]|uniref:GNAT family N-acetyltransferase n=2 Tax=Trinickia fusca TaxID=2419777 RepID=A0A494XPH3_9BURK|nr:hypothetical protein D7S89_03365 [Trinickia fusca]
MWQVESIAEFLETAARSASLHSMVLEPGAAQLEEVNGRLAGFYSSSGRGYLNSVEHHALDARLGVSQRSKIVTVRDRTGQLVSTVRLTPHPFESEGLVPPEADAGAFSGHFELSRLVSWYGGEFRTLPTALALGIALLQARSMGARGLVALARTPQRRVFAKFGLKPTHMSPLKVPIREDGDYWFLEAPIASVVDAAHAYTEQLQSTVPLLAPSSTF